jgi:hypothetical protein
MVKLSVEPTARQTLCRPPTPAQDMGASVLKICVPASAGFDRYSDWPPHFMHRTAAAVADARMGASAS